MPIALSIERRGPIKGAQFPLQVALRDDATVGKLKDGISERVAILPVERQRITTSENRALGNDDKRLEDLGVKSGDKLFVKDLGPQISWRTVFLVEYAGPLFIHPFIYYIAPHVWAYFGYPFTVSIVQKLTLLLCMLHFLKRELETIFVHRFSHATMPLFNIFKNSTHYWILSGVLIAVGVYSPFHGEEALLGLWRKSPTFLATCVIVWVLAEFGNLQTHIILMRLRPPGTRVRNIPRGGLFEMVSCPNYFYEVLSWVAVTVMTMSFAALLFTLVSAAQMTVWAIKKHKAYRSEFQGTYPKRKIMYPFVF
ncbi:very-long-chain enoyl-CoA reductase [Malassezia vespertilionis]|uniref:very-long-chain enoyl-CoA reductase n=1 Tax=Malassezia vespertilionis TaxID=2020962 RepID=UPI0024B15601|nr:very-long-chain enoyl-CoA reductase [Malassezia vespertilionis]WFD05792.1 very-long-chain enoyl-CoA reductase [Malassezia vespertilionis]